MSSHVFTFLGLYLLFGIGSRPSLFQSNALLAPKVWGKEYLWRHALGVGTSQIVSDGKNIYTMYATNDPQAPEQGDEIVIALNAKTGEQLWKNHYPIKRLSKQETYDEPRVRPQSSPALLKERLCTLGYTGLLKCYNSMTGKLMWEHDLVNEFKATPVQFGFSASPIVFNGVFIVHIGGTQTALAAFQPDTGQVLWQSEAGEPSYATPVPIRVGKEIHIVQVTRDAVVGFSAQNGQTCWTYPMPKPGLTNVPTPIAFSEGRLLISGQGVLGTRMLQIEREGEQYKVKELWKNRRATFFYCNWILDAQYVYGCIDEFLHGVDIKTGQEVWRERGQSKGNLAPLQDHEALILRRDGLLTRCKLTAKAPVPLSNLQVLHGKCWTSPLLMGDTVFVRDDVEIVAIKLSALMQKTQ